MNVWLESIQQWLMEIALSGFSLLNNEIILPFLLTLDKIKQESNLYQLSILMLGFVNELIQSIPLKDLDSIPIYRWVDLWTQGFLGTLKTRVINDETISVSGILYPLGVDINHHAFFFGFTLYGILEISTQKQFVRIPMSVYKVDSIYKDEVWQLFPESKILFESLFLNRSIVINNALLCSSGNLIWNGDAKLGINYDIMKTAEDFFSPTSKIDIQRYPLFPLNRHPVQLAEPIFLKNYKVKKSKKNIYLMWNKKSQLKVALERLNYLDDIEPAIIQKSTQIFGLLRYDAYEWSLQPLMVYSKKDKDSKQKMELYFLGMSALDQLQDSTSKSTVSILRERASRLMRG